MFKFVSLSLGSNKGYRLRNLRNAARYIALLDNFQFFRASGIYETDPWGFKKQNSFLNCVMTGFYFGKPSELFSTLKEIEVKVGRNIAPKWHPREIDIDILFFGNDVINKKKLIIPHPELHKRNFVLVPLNELIPDFVHPLRKITVKQLLKSSADECKVKIYNKSLI